MRTIAWIGLGLLALGCGGRVVGTMEADVGLGIDAAPPQRGPTDASLMPPPVDAGMDVARTDVPAVVVDARPDRTVVVDTGVDVPLVVDAGTDVILGRVCQVANPNACPAGSYCLSANCTTGNCVVAPTGDQPAPVCGCDRITYWNAAVAATSAPGVRASGACAGGVPCGGIAGTNCPTGTFCNFQVTGPGACNVADPTGRCWALPDVCPPAATGGGATNRRCNGNLVCTGMCDMIMNARVYYNDPTCP